jgi:hypothetical protein
MIHLMASESKKEQKSKKMKRAVTFETIATLSSKYPKR